MNHRIEPSIRPDIDQADAKQEKATKQPVSPSPKLISSASTPTYSVLSILNILIIYGTLLGGGYWFYQQGLISDQALLSAESRIVELENQLSATGEEMGESTIAMRAKLEVLIDKTDKLWDEMDKLWGSAWRKNQSHIKELRSKSIKTDNKIKEITARLSDNHTVITELSDKQTAASFNIDALAEQLTQVQSIKTDLNNLSGKIASIETKSSSRDKQQIELATMIAELDTSVKMLLERVQRLTASSPTG